MNDAKAFRFPYPEGVLVGAVRGCVPNNRWRWDSVAHLFPGNNCGIERLHVFAKSIGLKRSWFRDRPLFPHYDITKTKHPMAIEIGAILVDRKTEVGVLRMNFAKRIG